MQIYKSENMEITLPAIVERAAKVSDEAHKKLVIITPELQIVHLLSEYGLIVNPCPCGNFGNSAKTCNCETITVQRHQLNLQIEGQSHLQVECVFSFARSFALHGFDDSAKMLLKQAYTELKLGVAQMITIVEAGAAISRMEKSDIIKTEHIAEGISYRLLI